VDILKWAGLDYDEGPGSKVDLASPSNSSPKIKQGPFGPYI
jgi:hypothetical protein